MDSRRALLTGLFDHAAMFPPASPPLDEDERASGSEHAWLPARLVVPEGTEVEGPELAVVSPPRAAPGGPDRPGAGGSAGASSIGVERPDEVVHLEGVELAEVARRGARGKVRCGGGRVPPVEEPVALGVLA